MHRYLTKWMKECKVAIPKSAVDNFYIRGFPVKVPQPEKTLYAWLGFAFFNDISPSLLTCVLWCASERVCSKGFPHKVVEMKAGDLAIWRGELAHGNGHNVSNPPRIRYAQYVSYYPAFFENEAVRSMRVNAWKHRSHAGQVALPQLSQDGAVSKALNAAARGDPRKWEEKNLPAAELTELGLKLLGVEPWD
jgi:hypothetical protein